ncbi:M15 family metallopeptidase domain-containing protein [Microbacterium saperdae]|uniref:Uncharacterized protein n=1 Tax=Microbacterium saperdae TaxID=69368 RepID=A0A543BQV3_9MICO|nr:hypothetical protein [Microbacterium saperdae]TQL87202.1 hypothetical protein FB560_2869 [Microbacterium saperdae]GGM42130.1 hypothetical protein GCM10010489_11480 [Microbacterium saperdae]
MGGFTNGRFPLSMLVHLGGKIYLPAGTAARWRWMVAQALAKYGVLLYVTPGWNGYRPYDIQVEYRQELGNWAAVPGYSSHGLIYRGKTVAAVDVANWADLAPGNTALAWSRFKALCRLAEFTVDFVTPQELWHIGDFNDVWTVPGFASLTPAPPPIPLPEGKTMADVKQIHWMKDAKTVGGRALIIPGTAWALPFVESGNTYANRTAKQFATGDSEEYTKSLFDAFLSAAARCAPTTVRVEVVNADG